MEDEYGNGAARAPLVVAARLVMADWIRSFRWTCWAHPTFTQAVSRRFALRACRWWLRQLSRESYAIVAFERGPSGQLIHCHALVGGIPRSRLCEQFVGGLWRQGRIEVAPYDRKRDYPSTVGGASWYLTKTGSDAVEILGSPVVYRPRTRGGRNRP